MKKILVTGGCGFIGANWIDRLLSRGEHAVAYDNLSRRGAVKNAEWLRNKHGSKFELICADVRDAPALVEAARDADAIYHLGAQVAVTTSVADPRGDFEINALGTFNALEAARASGRNPFFLFASTNKVYGGMDDVPVVERATRYEFADLPGGVSEAQPLDFHSPYGCSKGAADQYVRDYHRIYGLRTVVFRQSAIYGYRQFGEEDQGWLAWFIIAAVLGRPTGSQIPMGESSPRLYPGRGLGVRQLARRGPRRRHPWPHAFGSSLRELRPGSALAVRAHGPRPRLAPHRPGTVPNPGRDGEP